MKPIHCRESSRLPIVRVLSIFCLAIVLVGCETNSAPTHPALTPTHAGRTGYTSPTATTGNISPTAISPASPDSLNLNAVNMHEEVGNLLVQSNHGFQCPYTYAYPDPPSDLVLGHLVLASNQTTYSQDEVTQISTYLTSPSEAPGILNKGTEPPPTLRWVLGGEAAGHAGIAGAPPPTLVCGAELILTNTGNTPIQIVKAGAQLKADPQENTYQYRLIDLCSIDVGPCTYPGSGGGGSCSVYSVSVQLGLGKQNDIFSAAPTADGGCSTLTIPPATQVSLDLSFFISANISQNLLYQIVPVFTADTTQGNQTLTFPQLASTLAFASANQFSCYALQGTTFVREQSPVFTWAFYGVTPTPDKEPHWCI